MAAHMPPFMAAELGESFNLERALQIGDFSRFLEVLSFSQGRLLNLASLAREAEIPRKRAESYLGILEDLLLGFRLRVFQRRAKRQLLQHQKFFFFDAGMFRWLRPRGPLDAPVGIEGLALESLVAQHLRALCQLRANGTQLSCWRTSAGLEVDFVVYGPNLFQAIEVKRSARVTSAELKSLRAFEADYPEAQQCLLLSFCQKPLLIDGIRREPLEGWLSKLRP